MRAILKSIEIEGLRSIVGPCKVNLPDHGLVFVHAKNVDTGGSSGSGKSSFLHAINYSIGTCGIPASRLQSWHEKPLQTTLTLDINGSDVNVARGESTHIQIDGQKHVGATAVNNQLQTLLKLNVKQLQALTSRAQKKRSFFLSLSDEEKKTFLTDAMPMLEKFEKLSQQSEEMMDSLKRKRAEAETSLNQKTSLAEALKVPEFTEEALDSFEVLVATTKQALLEAETVRIQYQEAFDRAVQKLNRTPIDTEQELIQQNLAKWRPLSGSALSKLREAQTEQNRKDAEYAFEIKNLEREILNHKAALAKEEQAVLSVAGLKLKIEQLKNQTCPTCDRKWDHLERTTAEIAKIEAQIEERYSALEKAKKGLTAAIKATESLRKPELDTNIAKMAEFVKQIAQQILEWEEIEQNFVKQHKEAMSKDHEEMMVLKSSVATASANFSVALAKHQTAVHDLENRKEQAKYRKQMHATCLSKFTQAQSAKNVAHETLLQVVQEHDQEADFSDMVGRTGFLGAIFDEILAEISVSANDILSQIPNTSGITIGFRSENVTQAGKIKRQINTVIKIDGHETSSKDGPSGGQESVLELAVDLAVSEVLRRRTGTDPAWLILDEPFEGCGTIETEALLEVLRKMSKRRLILIVDHATETREMFDRTIEIEYMNGISVIKEST